VDGRCCWRSLPKLSADPWFSVVADRHQADIESRRFWTWCAYDILGIIGALKANGRGVTTSPQTGSAIEVAFRSGRPAETEVVLFRPEYYSCSNVYEDWCPNSNLYEDAAAANAWASQRGIPGQVLNLVEATARAAKEWSPLTRGLGMNRS
jgi:hypothetical protein